MFHTVLFSSARTGGTYNLTLTTDQLNFNLRDYIISQEGSISSYNAINLTIASGVKIGATTPSNYAFDTGALSGVTLTVTNNGIISGAGGDGGMRFNAGSGNGGAGGDAMIFRADATLNNAGTIQGGGGGGGAGDNVFVSGGFIGYEAGGGGAGLRAGQSSTYLATVFVLEGADGTLSQGGVGTGNSGAGGNPGAAGSDGSNGTGGAAGDAIHKNGNTVTVNNTGTVTGATRDIT